MVAVFEYYLRFQQIAGARIPVAEDAPTYIYFLQRREIAKRIINSSHPKETDDYLLEMLNKTDELIKQYLYL